MLSYKVLTSYTYINPGALLYFLSLQRLPNFHHVRPRHEEPSHIPPRTFNPQHYRIQPPDHTIFLVNKRSSMCLQIVEKYAVCGCLYHRHAVDPCPKANQRGHGISTREVRVGYACSRHSSSKSSSGSSSTKYPDSGYSSGYYSSSGRR